MYYTRLTVRCDTDLREILIAELSQAGFDTFMETDEGIEAYALEEGYDAAEVERIFNQYVDSTDALYFGYDKVEKENWNQKWEDSIQPVVVEDACIVRAAFHKPEQRYRYDIVITPKMSFGTGHHATTYLMLWAQMETDHHNKTVMDAGCGTAVLTVMASLRGAARIEAFDIDDWSVINGKENLEINHVKNARLRQGKVADFDFPAAAFDLILANINKNILMAEMSEYRRCLKDGGQLLISGFYVDDAADLADKAKSLGGVLEKSYEREGWSALLLRFDRKT